MNGGFNSEVQFHYNSMSQGGSSGSKGLQMSYKHISFVQRCKISAYWKAGYLQKDIAKELDINPSTVSRELKRNRRWNGVYCPEQAASFYKASRQDHERRLYAWAFGYYRASGRGRDRAPHGFQDQRRYPGVGVWI